ncbi:MAG: 50S ribosomal protein L18 [Candidatus Sungbacteria bacterium]|nr:50S ribosomal protein L18 [Candidatus Sungbacteria bacterium]
MKSKLEKRKRRHKRVRAMINGTSDRPRLSVFASNRHLFLQLVDDETGQTLISVSDFNEKHRGPKKEIAAFLGETLAKKAKEKNIMSVVFDRGGRKYHGIVKEVAEGARKGGLKI